jgi:propionate CoA-transferase
MNATMTKPILTPDQAALLIRDGVTVAIGGSGAGHSIPGFYHRVIGGHWSISPSMAKLAAASLFEAYCLPAGIVVQLFHAAASGSPGFISEIGLGTFIDPRAEGGKLNARTVEDIVELWNRDGKEYLYYRAHAIDVALIRGAVADEEGNLSMHEEVAPWHNCAMAQAARAAGGMTIAQKARKVVFCGTLAVRGGKAKFVPAVRQITFSGAHAVSTGQEVLYVTEAAVFRLTAEGLQLEEVAPGLDPERDVIAKMAFRPMMGASVATMRAELFAPALLPADCFPAFQ